MAGQLAGHGLGGLEVMGDRLGVPIPGTVQRQHLAGDLANRTPGATQMNLGPPTSNHPEGWTWWL